MDGKSAEYKYKEIAKGRKMKPGIIKYYLQNSALLIKRLEEYKTKINHFMCTLKEYTAHENGISSPAIQTKTELAKKRFGL